MHIPNSVVPSTLIHQGIERRVFLHDPGTEATSTACVWVDSAEDVYADGDTVDWPDKRHPRRRNHVRQLTRASGLVRFALVADESPTTAPGQTGNKARKRMRSIGLSLLSSFLT